MSPWGGRSVAARELSGDGLGQLGLGRRDQGGEGRGLGQGSLLEGVVPAWVEGEGLAGSCRRTHGQWRGCGTERQGDASRSTATVVRSPATRSRINAQLVRDVARGSLGQSAPAPMPERLSPQPSQGSDSF